jgi:hypothetical protein
VRVDERNRCPYVGSPGERFVRGPLQQGLDVFFELRRHLRAVSREELDAVVVGRVV